jgi:hypothetical protein
MDEINAPEKPVANPTRLTMGGFWRDVADEVFSSDRGLPWTAWRLTVDPGGTIRAYVMRRDPKVTRPLRYFLVGFAVAVLLFQSVNNLVSTEHVVRIIFGSGAGATALWAVFQHMLWLTLVTVVPAIACGLRIAYASDRPTFAEMWVFAVYVSGHLLIIMGFTLWALLFGLTDGSLRGAIAAIMMVCLPPLYLIATCLGYFPHPGAWRAARALFATVLSYAMSLALASGILMAAFQAGKIWPSLFVG